MRYLTLTSLGRMSFKIGPLCAGLINTLLSLAGSRHNCTLPFAFCTRAKLLHHSEALPTSNGATVCCFCNLSSSSLSVCCGAYATSWAWAAALLHLQLECALDASNDCKYIYKFAVKFCLSNLLASLSGFMFALDLN